MAGVASWMWGSLWTWREAILFEFFECDKDIYCMIFFQKLVVNRWHRQNLPNSIWYFVRLHFKCADGIWRFLRWINASMRKESIRDNIFDIQSHIFSPNTHKIPFNFNACILDVIHKCWNRKIKPCWTLTYENYILKWHEQKSSLLVDWPLWMYGLLWVCAVCDRPNIHYHSDVKQWNLPYISWLRTPIRAQNPLKHSRIHAHSIDGENRSKERWEKNWQASSIWVKPIKTQPNYSVHTIFHLVYYLFVLSGFWDKKEEHRIANIRWLL